VPLPVPPRNSPLRIEGALRDRLHDAARALFACVTTAPNRVLATSSASIAALRLLEQLPNTPIVTVTSAMGILQATKPTAGRAIDVVSTSTPPSTSSGKKRDRTFAYRAYLDLLRVDTE
jgi:hypothetical protein